MKKKINMTVLLLAAVVATACSSTLVKEQEKDNSPKTRSVRTVNPFTRICIDDVCDVYFTQADTIGVVVTGRRNTIARLDTEVSNGELHLKWDDEKKMRNIANKEVTAYITAPTLKAVTVKGCGDFHAEKRLDADSLRVFLSGVGDINMAGIVCEDIDVKASGVGDITIKNLACEKSRISLNGTGDISIGEIDVADTEINLHGVGDINMSFQDCGRATCNLKGVGDMTLKGSLRQLEKNRNGVGDINTSGLKVGN